MYESSWPHSAAWNGRMRSGMYIWYRRRYMYNPKALQFASYIRHTTDPNGMWQRQTCPLLQMFTQETVQPRSSSAKVKASSDSTVDSGSQSLANTLTPRSRVVRLKRYSRNRSANSSA